MSYSDADKARAIGLGLAQGADAAAKATGIPRRTVTRWLAAPDAQTMVLSTREQLADELWQAVQVGVRQLIARMTDPEARLGDVARALEVAAQQHALLTGGATARTETTVNTAPAMTWQQEEDLRAFLDALDGATDEELAEWAASGGLAMLRDAQVEAKQLEAGHD